MKCNNPEPEQDPNQQPPKQLLLRLSLLTAAIMRQSSSLLPYMKNASTVAASARYSHVRSLLKSISASLGFSDEFMYEHIETMLRDGSFKSHRFREVELELCNPATRCYNCNHALTVLPRQSIKIIGSNGVESAGYLPKECQNKLCSCHFFDIDSGTHKLDERTTIRSYYSVETLKERGYIFLNNKYVVSWSVLKLFCVEMVTELCEKSWNIQELYRNSFCQSIPTPKDYPLFKRGYILYNCCRLASWIKQHPQYQNTAPEFVSAGGVFYLQENKGADKKSLDDLREAMEGSNKWFEVYFVEKNRHSCRECHKIGPTGEVLSAMTEDGKVMGNKLFFQDETSKLTRIHIPGHRVCPIRPCTLPLVNPVIGFCSLHQHERYICFVRGCTDPRRNQERTTFSCNKQEHIFIEDKVRKSGMSSENRRINRKQAVQQRAARLKGIPESVCHQEKHESSQSGMVKYVKKLFTFESNDDILPMMVATFDALGEDPSHLYYDKNCIKLRSIAKKLRDLGEITSESSDFHIGLLRVYLRVFFLLDEFHFLRHTEEFCTRYCNPSYGKDNCKRVGVSDFNTQIAEQTNVWFGEVSHIMKNLDACQHDFFMWNLVDFRNEQIGKRLEKKNKP
ncbi:hypothetical protein BDR26DRAFT_981053 [Obelidium mucronatum]|nr:hypothetical protein BDR26DRAFT_981053 [Obelidium mucronatum]